MTEWITVTIDELVLDSNEPKRDSTARVRAEVARVLRERAPEPAARRAPQIGDAVARAVDGRLPR